MKKTLVALLLVAAMLLSVVPAMAYTSDALPYEGETITYSVFGADLITQNEESAVYQEYMKGLGNIEFVLELVPLSDIDTKNSVYLNSGDISDIMWTRGNTSVVKTYGDMGYWLDLDPYLDEYMPNFKWWLENYEQNQLLYDENGALYPIVTMDYYDYVAETWFYNKTVLDGLGYTEPPKTWDEMHEMMLAFKTAYPDQTPFYTNAWGMDTYLNVFSYLSDWQNSSWYFNEETQKWDNAIINPESGYKDLVALMNTMYSEGLIHPEFDALAADQVAQALTDGAYLFGFFYVDGFATRVGGKLSYEAGTFTTPALKEGDDRYGMITVRGDGLPGWAYFASAEAEHPEILASILDYTLSEEACNLYNWGILGTSYEIDENGKKYYLEDYATNADKQAEVGIKGVHLERMNFVQDWYANFETLVLQVSKDAQDLLADELRTGELKDKLPSRATPNFTTEENDTIATSTTPMATYLSENVINFITGVRSMDEWDAFVEEYKSMGDYEQVLSIYDNAEQYIYTNVRNFPDFIDN